MICRSLIAALLATALGLAAAPASAAEPGAASAAQPAVIVRRGIDRLSAFLSARETTSPQAMMQFLDRVIAPLFDFDYMAHWAAGPYARRLDASQRAALGERMRTLFLEALARNLGSYQRPLPRVDVYPARRGRAPNEALVPSMVRLGPVGMRIDFRFYAAPDGWKIFDVAANGTSAVAFYRSYFTHLLRRYGPAALEQ